MKEKQDKICGNCKYFQAKDNKAMLGSWVVAVGVCTHPKPELGGACTWDKELAEFRSCLQFESAVSHKGRGL